MSPEEQTHIRAVGADPDSDAPRLDYASWLEGQGRRDRARLIRLQCQIEQLQGEESRLLELHHDEWGRELRAHGANWWVFHRGFPEEIGIPIGDFLGTHRDLGGVTPIRNLHLTGGTDAAISGLAGLPAMSRVRALEIDRPTQSGDSGGVYGTAGVAALAGSKHLTNLTRLDLHSHRIGEAGALQLAASPSLVRLTHLALTAPKFDRSEGDFLSAMANAPALQQLQHFQLGSQVYGPHVLDLIRRHDTPQERTP